MKRPLIIIFSTLLIALPFAQTHAQVKKTNLTAPTDDVLNATSAADTSLHIASNIGYYELVRITTKVRKNSGTVAGIALLQGSDDGSPDSWFDLNTDTLTITNQAISKKSWLVSPHSWPYLRVWIRLATGVATPVTWFYGLKPDPVKK